jgi:hypothetical protein
MQRPEAELARTEKNKLYKKGNAEEGTVAEASNSADLFFILTYF